MASETKCLTPGAWFHTRVTSSWVSVNVDLGRVIELSSEEAELIEDLIHNQLELVLRPYFKETADEAENSTTT